jgi:hypothetical protein
MTEGIADKGSPNYDAVVAAKYGYFGAFWWARSIAYMGGWLYFTIKLRKNSIAADSVLMILITGKM